MEVDLAESLRVGLGDHVTWDFAGVPVESRIASLRSVDWARFETNFYVVFEPGTLEEAPQSAVILSRIEGAQERAELQRDLVVRFANVSVLDLSLLQQTIDTILQRANQGIRFLGVFSTVAGVFVLIGALATSRYQRMRESALLKTLGARRRVVLQILTVEYAVLGSLATAAGLVLAIFAGWLMTWTVFEVPFRLDLGRIGTVWLWITGVTVVVGLIGSRGAPPVRLWRCCGMSRGSGRPFGTGGHGMSSPVSRAYEVVWAIRPPAPTHCVPPTSEGSQIELRVHPALPDVIPIPQ